MKGYIPIDRILTGVWHNQHNSEVHLDVDSIGRISGCFINGINVDGGRSESFPITGFAKGYIFTFSADLSKYGCLTSWVGQIAKPDDRHFEANWQMIADAHHKPDARWKATWTGTDTFEAGSRESEKCGEKSTARHPMYCSIV